MSALNAQPSVDKSATSTTSSRIAYLDGLRAVAILFVFLFHFGGFFGGAFPGGSIGVDIFFALSGYIITRILWQRRDTLRYGDFLLGRVRRLYPALIGLVIVGGGLAVVVAGLSKKDTLISGILVLLQANSINVPAGWFNFAPFGVTWSLSAEWLSYLLLPLVILAVRRFSTRTATIVMVACVALLYGTALLLDPAWFYFGPLSRGAQIFGGGAIALGTLGLVPSARLSRILSPLAVVAFAGLVLWGAIGPSETTYRYGGILAIVLAVGMVIVAGSLDPSFGLSRVLSARPLAAVGRASYSFYLWHTVVPVVFAPFVALNTDPALFVIYIALALVATWFSYTYLEKPFMRARSSALVPQGASVVVPEPEPTKA